MSEQSLRAEQQKSMILMSAQELQTYYQGSSRSPQVKSSCLNELEGMLTVIGYVFGDTSHIYRSVHEIWSEVNATPLAR